jgi:amino acid permease
VNIVKAFVGLGILAAPHGFMECGILLSLSIFVLMGYANQYTILLQQRTANQYGKKVKSYTDLAECIYGKKGQIMMVTVIVLAQILVCSSYIMFFQKQINQVMY